MTTFIFVKVEDTEQETTHSKEKRPKRKRSSHIAEHSKLIRTEPSWISERIKEEFVKVEVMEEESPIINAHDIYRDIPIDELPEDLSSPDLPMPSMASRNELQNDLSKFFICKQQNFLRENPM